MSLQSTDNVHSLVYLAGCVVREEAPDREKLKGIETESLYQLSKQHMMTAAVGMALESCGLTDKRFQIAVLQAQRRLVLLEAAKEHLFAEMDKAGIWHMPLKGAVLKDYYPKFGMREMSDYDILFDSTKAEKVREIMEAAGFETQHYGGKAHDVYIKPPSLHFELHKRLFGPRQGDRIFDYYSGIEQRLEAKENNPLEYRFRQEDFYIFLIAHTYKHYADKGTGLRSLLDVYVSNHKLNLDYAYIDKELKKLGLLRFEKSCRSLAEKLYGRDEPEVVRDEMLDVILNGGVYGSMDNRIKRRLNIYGAGFWGKLKYLQKRIFIPMSEIKDTYPFIWHHKVLLPLVPLNRIWKAVTIHRKRAKEEISALARYRHS